MTERAEGSDKFTKIAGSLLADVRDLVDWGVEGGHTTEQQLRLTISARKEAVAKLHEQGLSQRQIAAAVGADKHTVLRDLAGANAPANGANAPVGEPNGSPSTRELLSQSDQNDWRTPRKFLDAARAVMGTIDLDPATSVEANETVGAAEFYTEADNGLAKPWKGCVWLNPPYGGNARLFVERLIREYEVGNVTAACALVNSHPTETKWFQQLFSYTVCFIHGRIDFGGPSRAISSTSTHGSAIVFLGKDTEKFRQKFSAFGAVVRKI